jgi:sugar lactone lactonase YvrE
LLFKNSLRIAVVSCVISMLNACVSGSGIPDQITAARGGFVPEGIEYDNANNRFLTGSLADGTIYEITNSGQLVPFIVDADLVASVGIEVDEERNRLLVANAESFGAPGPGAAKLGVYDLTSGEQLAMVDLAGTVDNADADAGFFANDVAVSAAGTVFITDTQMGVIYSVNRYYDASVLVDFGRDSGLFLNGIEYHPAGYLIAVSSSEGQLIKIPLNSPNRWSLVELDFPAAGGDGLIWAADGGLVSTSNNSGAVMKYHSDDHWNTARLTGMASFPGQATTAALVGDDVYVVQPHFADAEPPVILRARF